MSVHEVAVMSVHEVAVHEVAVHEVTVDLTIDDLTLCWHITIRCLQTQKFTLGHNQLHLVLLPLSVDLLPMKRQRMRETLSLNRLSEISLAGNSYDTTSCLLSHIFPMGDKGERVHQKSWGCTGNKTGKVHCVRRRLHNVRAEHFDQWNDTWRQFRIRLSLHGVWAEQFHGRNDTCQHCRIRRRRQNVWAEYFGR